MGCELSETRIYSLIYFQNFGSVSNTEELLYFWILNVLLVVLITGQTHLTISRSSIQYQNLLKRDISTTTMRNVRCTDTMSDEVLSTVRRTGGMTAKG
jgi:hypothetical protein